MVKIVQATGEHNFCYTVQYNILKTNRFSKELTNNAQGVRSLHL